MANTLITFLESFTPMQERIIIAIIGGLLPSLVWLFFWLREDDCKNQDTVAYICAPEPKPMLLLTFLTGMLMVPLALILERSVYGIQVSLGSMQFIVGGILLVIAWSSIEEILKLFGYWFVNAKSKFINEPSDPAIYMLTCALGFAAAENAFFLYQSLSVGQTFDAALGGQMLRFVGASLLHVGSSGLIGICMGLAFFHGRISKMLATICGVILGITVHVVFNYLVIFAEQTNILRVFGFVWVLSIGLIILFERVKELHPHQEM